jgi:predicted nuclease of predicted toxin-antitoxin system
MRLLANENIPGVAVTALVAEGHDVAWVRTAAPGIADFEVLAWAARESRILLTFDNDFGELARTATLPRNVLQNGPISQSQTDRMRAWFSICRSMTSVETFSSSAMVARSASSSCIDEISSMGARNSAAKARPAL